jgi:hypothetical protein
MKNIKTIGIITGTLLSLYGGIRLGMDIYEPQQPPVEPEQHDLILSLVWNNDDCNVDTLPTEVRLLHDHGGFGWGDYTYAKIEDNGQGLPKIGNTHQDEKLTDILNGGKVTFSTRGYPDTAIPPSTKVGDAFLTIVPFLEYGCD